jgi:hypothetical protein
MAVGPREFKVWMFKTVGDWGRSASVCQVFLHDGTSQVLTFIEVGSTNAEIRQTAGFMVVTLEVGSRCTGTHVMVM